MDDSTGRDQHGKLHQALELLGARSRTAARARHFTSDEWMSFRLAEHRTEDRNERLAGIREALGPRSIVLIGLMGAGKTAVGRRLANRLELPFIDADTEIEVAAGQSHSRDLRRAWRSLFPPGRAQGHRAPARRRPASACHRRRRLYECRHAGQHQGAWHLDLAQGRAPRAVEARGPARQQAVAFRVRSRNGDEDADGRALSRSMPRPT